MGVAGPADVDFYSFDHDDTFDRSVRPGEGEAEFVVSLERRAYGQVDFVGDVRGNVHARISAFSCDVDVGFAAFNDCVYGDRSIVNIQIESLEIVEIVDAEAESAIEGLAADANLRGMPEPEHHTISRLNLVDPSMTYSAPADTPLERSQKGILIRAGF